MPVTTQSKPVEDSVPQINNEFAVGSDLGFQARWARFERIVWIFLVMFLLLSVAGVFGRGPLANAEKRASDGSIDVKYERVQRFGTPSVLTVQFPASSIRNGTVQLWADDSLVKPLGTQRVVPQPQSSVIGGGGILYTFPATTVPASVEFQTQPAVLGSSELKLRVPGKAEFTANIFVVP
jgi:hypothetical protein